MKVEFNHTIIHCKSKTESAVFVAEILGLPAPIPFIHFLVVRMTNNASLDFIETSETFVPQHYAFLVGEKEFDEIFGRIKSMGIAYWADPAKKMDGQINTYFGGRGFYFEEPSGNFLEVMTKPYDLGVKG